MIYAIVWRYMLKCWCDIIVWLYDAIGGIIRVYILQRWQFLVVIRRLQCHGAQTSQVHVLWKQSKSVRVNTNVAVVHCKNIWVTSTIFWSCQLHACCVRDTLQTSRDAFNLVESFRVVETLLIFVTLGSSCRNPSYLATFLPKPGNQGTPPGVNA